MPHISSELSSLAGASVGVLQLAVKCSLYPGIGALCERGLGYGIHQHFLVPLASSLNLPPVLASAVRISPVIQ